MRTFAERQICLSRLSLDFIPTHSSEYSIVSEPYTVYKTKGFDDDCLAFSIFTRLCFEVFFFFLNLNKAWPPTLQLILSVQKQKQIISCHHFSLIVHSYCFPEYLSSMPSVDGSLLNNNTLFPEISPAVIVIS